MKEFSKEKKDSTLKAEPKRPIVDLQQISEAYSAILTKAMRSSKTIAAPTKKEILDYVSSACKSTALTSKKTIDYTAVLVNALLASDFSQNMESWLKKFNEGVPSIYDKAMDAQYAALHEGGGNLHRLFDGSHTLWGAWEKVREAAPEDSLLQEVFGYLTALGKDLSSPVGLPLFAWNKPSYEQVAELFNAEFDVPKSWLADLVHVNATELIGSSIAAIAVALNWNKGQVKQFTSLASSLGISAIASANPALAVLALAALAKAFVDATQKGDYSEFVNGLAKGGVGTGIFLATSSAIGGPVWVGIIAGMCVGAAVNKSIETVEVSQVATFVEEAMKKATTRLKEVEST